MYEVRVTILNPKSKIVNKNTLLSTSGAGRCRATAAAAGTALGAGVVSTASCGHPKHRKYLVDTVALAGRAKQLFPFPCAPKIFVKFCVALITFEFVYRH